MTAAWSTEPYWWDDAPRRAYRVERLPERVDVAIVGAGFTGLSAAIELARAGRSVLVLDARRPGEGASARNGGMIGHGHRVGFGTLSKRYGEAKADGIVRAGLDALSFATGLIEREAIDCDYVRCGRFRGAWTPGHYKAMAAEVELLRTRFGSEVDLIGPAGTRDEVATERYHGGAVFHAHGGLHPGKFHDGLLRSAEVAGAVIAGDCPVRAIAGERGAFRLTTGRADLSAREVIVATNAYTHGLSRDLARRVVPIPSFLVATEPLGQNRVRSLIPGGRMIVETRSAHCYYRASPDGQRILLGARAALHPIAPERATARLVQHLTGLFPQLSNVAITHSWMGFVAFTRQDVPAIGVRDGIHYAIGYGGSGVAMAPFLGFKIAHKLLGDAEGASGLDDLPFAAVPFYDGRPWFAPALSWWYRLQDRREGSG